MQVEADCYHCLTNMLDKAQDNYVHDSKGFFFLVLIILLFVRRFIYLLDKELGKAKDNHGHELRPRTRSTTLRSILYK